MGRNSAPPEVRLPGAVLNSFDRAIKERLIVVGANRGLCESRAVFCRSRAGRRHGSTGLI
jgi:hypothetical protein